MLRSWAMHWRSWGIVPVAVNANVAARGEKHMLKRVMLTTVMSSLVLISSGGAALGAAREKASCIGIGASVTASTGGSTAAVLAVVRDILGTRGIGAWATPMAQRHEGTVETCFPDFPAP
jgi:hypothetical protein